MPKDPMNVKDPHDGVAEAEREATASVLLYSDDISTREAIKLGIGRRPSADSPLVEFHDVATPAAVIHDVENGNFDLLILDGESAKFGGMGLCRTLKAEIYKCPPVLVTIGRAQDAWLASWSEADGVVSMPLRPIELQETVARMLGD